MTFRRWHVTLSNANYNKIVNVIYTIVSDKLPYQITLPNYLGKKIDRVIQPVFTSKKISEDLKVTETKPSLVNQQCVVYEFQCNSCDSNYIGYTSRHLHLRIEEDKYSVIGKHLQDKHNQRPTNLHEQVTILKKCHGKLECLIYEMLW